MLNSTLFLILFFASLLAINAQDPCFLDLSSTNVLILDKEYEILLLTPNQTTIEFAYDTQFKIICAEGSTSSMLSDSGEEVYCRGATDLYLSRTQTNYSFTNIKCVQKLPATVLISGSYCQNKGIGLEIGFPVSGYATWKYYPTVYTVCFDQDKLVPLNATFNASYDHWGAFSDEPTQHYFVDDGHLYPDIDLDSLYNNQIDMFTNWGVPAYHTDEVYLIKGQLLPSYLFTFHLYSDSSFNYVNVVPQWSTLRSVFAEFVDGFVRERKTKPKTYVAGTSGVATINNSEGKVELYLDHVGSKVPVPRWIWFTFENSFTIYGYNNPYYDNVEVEDEFNEMCVLPYSFEMFKDMLIGVCGGDPNVDV